MTLSFEIPVVFTNQGKGRKHILIDRERLPYFLQLKVTDIDALSRSRLLSPLPSGNTSRPPIDYDLLAKEYSLRLSSGKFPNKAALARSLGVSRAWVTKVLKVASGQTSPRVSGSKPARDHRAGVSASPSVGIDIAPSTLTGFPWQQGADRTARGSFSQ